MTGPPPDGRRPLGARLALAVLRLYPPVWRRRYGAELRAFIDDHGVTRRDVLDLAWGALRERWRGPNGPDPLERPLAAARWRGWKRFLEYQAIGFGVGAASYGSGWLLGIATGPLPDFVGLWLVGTIGVTAGLVCLHGLRLTYRQARFLPGLPPPPKTPLTRRLYLLSAGLFLLITVFLGALHEPPQWTFILDYLWLASLPALPAFGADVRTQRLSKAVAQYFGSRYLLRHARVELQRLESIATLSTSPDMVRQLAEIDRLESDMATALETLRHPDQPADEDGTPAAS